ncbi:MAG: hypothetical protein ACI82S_001856 [Patiriisocius sp.]
MCYLKPIYASLITLYQRNTLLMKNNAIDGKATIIGVQIENKKSNVIINYVGHIAVISIKPCSS